MCIRLSFERMRTCRSTERVTTTHYYLPLKSDRKLSALPFGMGIYIHSLSTTATELLLMLLLMLLLCFVLLCSEQK